MRPAAARPCISRKSWSDSSSVSAEFGSSNRKTRASRASARAISVRCWVASVQLPKGRSARWRDAEGVHQLAVVAPEARPEQAAALAPDHQILGDGQIGKELRLLMHDRDGRRRIGEAPAAAVEGELARIGRLFAGEDAHQRALAGAVRSGDPQHLARPQLEIEPVERQGIAVALAQAPDADGRRLASAPRHVVMPPFWRAAW